ncbi:TM2 domain-containing protein [Aestuariispira ectoiniformans]|uniref:TM2 domain-containing protein n=1 Tax=Aestuariispira ectoiniformans TaxID=2775080 RepID=UPI00223BF294|nr:TM2 domain-containing protein [Aestuariispira ectoiniformans]
MSESDDHRIFEPRPRRSRRAWASSPWTLAIAYGLLVLVGAFGIHNFYLRRPIYGACQLIACLLGLLMVNLGWGLTGGVVLMGVVLSLAWDMLTIPKVLLDRQ